MGARSVLQLQQLVGNRAVTEMIQRSVATGEATTAVDTQMDDGCACGGSCSKCSTVVSRAAATDTGTATSKAPKGDGKTQAANHLVDGEPGPGQMTKDAFLSELQSSVTASASVILAPTGWSADNCPDLARWFAYYRDKDAAHVERAIQKYALGTANAESARDYIPAITSKIKRAVLKWTVTGEVTGVPEEATAMPGAPPVPDAENIASGMGTDSEEGGPQPPVQRAARDGANAGDNAAALVAGLGQGERLDGSVAARFGSALGGDFSHVRVHRGAEASTAASALDARAFTYGHHIGFDAGQYRPGTPVGDAILAHELAHVNQQRGAAATLGTAPRRNATALGTARRRNGSIPTGPTGDDTALEHDADRAATGAIAHLWGAASQVSNGLLQASQRLRAARPRLQRCPRPARPPAYPPGTQPGQGDYLIETLPPNASRLTRHIFFERNKSTIPGTEATKIHGIANPTGRHQASDPLGLFGFASEDETNKSALAQARMDAVEAAVVDASPPEASAPTQTNRHNAKLGEINYSRARMVETKRGTAGSDELVCQPAAVPCTPQQQATLDSGVVQGPQWIQEARDKIAADDPAAVALVARFFTGGVSPMPATVKTTILGKLDAWKTYLETVNQPGRHECRRCGECNSKNAYYDPSTGKIVLCPSWLKKGPQEAIGTLVHEAGHGAPGVRTTDHAYRHSRRILALTQDEALDNTDSFVLLIRSLKGHTVNIGPKTPDDVTALDSGGSPNSEQDQARRALGWVDNHLTQAYQLVNSAYNYTRRCRDQGQWLGGSGRRPMEKVTHRLPGISTPDAIGSTPGPTEADQHALAAIHDRYYRMHYPMWGKPITFVKGAINRWAAGPGATVTLNDTFFDKDARGQLDELLKLIVEATPNISPALEQGYVDLIEDLRIVRGVGGP